jgi:CoA-transferase family III
VGGLSIDGADTLLDGWRVQLSAAAHAPVSAAGAILEQFGAVLDPRRAGDPARLRLLTPSGRLADARLTGWQRDRAVTEVPANGDAFTAYTTLRLVGVAALGARRGLDGQLRSRQLAAELATAVTLNGGNRPELVRCRDGWVVTRWREDAERDLFQSLVGDAGTRTRGDVVAEGRLARLLIAAVEPPAALEPPIALGEGIVRGEHRHRRRPRVVDWSVLWAGPWAADQLRRSGAVVQRIEHPRRRDGLLGWPEGRRLWWRLNEHKRVSLLDARRACDRERLETAIKGADMLITSMTPRALRSLEFDDGWRESHAPHLLHLELVAFEPPWEDAPGLGEHAAAQAGLLWRGGELPGRPAPWADPLLAATALAVAQIWLAGSNRAGGRVRLSLERAATLAFALSERAAGAQSGIA